MFKAKKLKKGDEFLNNPTVADMLGMFLNDSGVITQSISLSLSGEDRISKTNTSSYSSSSSNIRTNNDIPSNQTQEDIYLFPLGDQYF